jgi:hypothetical protein
MYITPDLLDGIDIFIQSTGVARVLSVPEKVKVVVGRRPGDCSARILFHRNNTEPMPYP